MVSGIRLVISARLGNAGVMAPSVRLRPLSIGDLDAVLDLRVAADIAALGEVVTTVEEITAELDNADFFAVGAEGADGALLASAWVERPWSDNYLYGDLTLRPGAPQEALDAPLAWLRTRASEIAPGMRLWVFADEGNAAKRAVYEAAGGTVIRRFFRMAIDFNVTPLLDVPDLASGVEIRPMRDTETDRRTMHAVVDTAFLDHFGHDAVPYENWARHVAGACPDPSLYWLATVDGAPAGGVYCCELPGAGYVDCLGTLRAFRGSGLGRALLLTAFAEFRRRSLTRVTLGVDASSPTGAVGLYESVGMKVEHKGMRYELAPL